MLTVNRLVLAGLAAGVTEAVAVVTPMEVIKIRLQAQHHSMADPLDIPKYRNAAHALYTVIKEEGFGALYRGVSLTALRQGMRQSYIAIFPSYSAYRVQPSRELHSIYGIQAHATSIPTRICKLTYS